MYRSKCALANFLDHFGDKWSLLIIRDIFIEKTTFSDFIKSQEGIASNILTNRLKSLIEHGLIDYKINPENKKIKLYYLTDKAVDVYPVIIEMVKWSDKKLNKELKSGVFGADMLVHLSNDGPVTILYDSILKIKI